MPVLVPLTTFVPRRRKRTPAAPPVPGPVLLAASFESVNAYLTLGFDRAIDMGAFTPWDVVVLDAGTAQEFGGTATFDVLDPATVRVTCIVNAVYEGEATTLTATGGAGIVSTVGAEPWAGVSDVALPYP